MNRLKWLLYMTATVCAGARPLTTEEISARVNGASACVYLRVVDDRDVVVTNATVMGNFHMNDEKGNPFKGATGADGIYVASGKCVGDWHYVVSKDGHYETSVDDNFRRTGVAKGRWQPYGMTNKVVLKRIVNPVAMYAFDYMAGHAMIPKVAEPLGYDLMAGDWVAPYGDGKVPDFDVTYLRDGEGREYSNLELILSTRAPFAGFVKIKSDTYSAFKSPHHADTNAVYKREVRFSFGKQSDGKRGHRYVDGQMTADECIILRTRTRLDRDGKLAGAHFGKIYGPMYFGVARNAPGSVKLLHYLNPTENDTNLEYDPHRNLLHPQAGNTPP